MGSIIGWLVLKGVPQRFARPLAIGALILALVAVLGAVKCSYDRNLIRNHDAKQTAATAVADRKADTNAADQRRVDDARQTTETTQIKEAVNEAGPNPAARRAAYYRCVSAQQSARRTGKLAATC